MKQNIFEIATKEAIRFTTNVKGNITVEDLWAIPLTSNGLSLDKIAIGINKGIEESATESFVTEKTLENKTEKLKLDIVKHIIKVKLEEEAERKSAAENKIERDKILAILAEKEDATLSKQSTTALKKRLDELKEAS